VFHLKNVSFCFQVRPRKAGKSYSRPNDLSPVIEVTGSKLNDLGWARGRKGGNQETHWINVSISLVFAIGLMPG